jgi:serine/threonine-protein kinase RsbW
MDQIEYRGGARLGVVCGPLARHAAAPCATRERAGLAPSGKQPDADQTAEPLSGMGALEQGVWPPEPPASLCWRRVFPGKDPQLAVLRRWLALLLPECGARDDLTYVASELAANAVAHTASGRPGGLFVVVVTWSPSVVRIAVADGGAPSGPHMVADPAGERGRGLLVVTGLAARTGVCGDRRGRLVWADVPWENARVPQAEPSAHLRAWFGGFPFQRGGPGTMPLVGMLLGGLVIDGHRIAGLRWRPSATSAGGPKPSARVAVTRPILVGGAS